MPGENSNYIPEELREQILVRLPTKSLMRFKSVCKAWPSMFHCRRFMSLYSRLHPGSSPSVLHMTPKLDLVKVVPELADLGLTDMPNSDTEEWNRVITVSGPLSNGIYCLTSHPMEKYSSCFSLLTGKIVLFNPATLCRKLIDPFPCEFHSILSDIKPSKILFGFTFGDDLDYKVVVLISYAASFFAFVYSMQSREWRKVVDYERGVRNIGHKKATQAFDRQDSIVDFAFPLEVCSQKLLKGRWHWMSQGTDAAILSFDFADDAFQIIGRPPEAYVDYHDMVLLYQTADVMVLHHHLAAIYFYKGVGIDIWMMKEYGVEQSWNRIFKIKTNFDGQFRRLLGLSSRPPRKGEEEDQSGGVLIKSVVFKDDNNQIISCDDVGYKVTAICDSSQFICWNVPGVSSYAETLEPL